MASPKFWHFMGLRNFTFHHILLKENLFWKVRCTAFQWCITLRGQKWAVWPGEVIFSKKCPKGVFRRRWFRAWLQSSVRPILSNKGQFLLCPLKNLVHNCQNSRLVDFFCGRRWKKCIFCYLKTLLKLMPAKEHADSFQDMCDTWGSWWFLAKLLPLKVKGWRKKWKCHRNYGA